MLLLKNLRWYSAGEESHGDIRIAGGRIQAMGRGLRPRPEERALDLSDHVALPGLINAHDHLSLNLFPRQGSPPYANFYEWARDVYRPDHEVQRGIVSVPLRDRLWWGAYRNLIGGATTVVHHDPYVHSVFSRPFPVDVLRRYGWAHSLGFGRRPEWKAGWARFWRRPFMIHAAEGTDEASAREMDVLHERGMLASNTVLVHAIALQPRHVDLIADVDCAVVWCPVSNEYLFRRMTPIGALRHCGVAVALGTDSTLSGSATLLHEMRCASRTGLVSPEELLAMVTNDAARIFRLRDGRGMLREGGRADMAVFPDGASTPARIVLHALPHAVIVRGEVRLAHQDIAARLGLGPPSLTLRGIPTWVFGDVRGLMRRIAGRVGSETLVQNPVWRLMTGTVSQEGRQPEEVAAP